MWKKSILHGPVSMYCDIPNRIWIRVVSYNNSHVGHAVDY